MDTFSFSEEEFQHGPRVMQERDSEERNIFFSCNRVMEAPTLRSGTNFQHP
jgi:hypothetical protein